VKGPKIFFQYCCITRCMSRPKLRYKISDHSLTPFPRNNQFHCANWSNKWKPFKRFSIKSAKIRIQNRLPISYRVYFCIIYCLVSNLNVPVDLVKNFKIYTYTCNLRLLNLSGVPLMIYDPNFYTTVNIYTSYQYDRCHHY
jgi:hypothetical protein